MLAPSTVLPITDTITISAFCDCGAITPVTVPIESYALWSVEGVKIEDALPDLSAEERDRLTRGTCPSCWRRRRTEGDFR